MKLFVKTLCHIFDIFLRLSMVGIHGTVPGGIRRGVPNGMVGQTLGLILVDFLKEILMILLLETFEKYGRKGFQEIFIEEISGGIFRKFQKSFLIVPLDVEC